MRVAAAATMVALLAAGVANAKAPTIAPADDPKHFGPVDRAMFWNLKQKVAGYRNVDRLLPTRAVRAGGTAYPLPPDPVDFSGLEFKYLGKTRSLEDYVRDGNVAGLLVVHDGKIALERYELGNDENTRWISFSIAKSVVSMLLGAAIADGFIESIDEKITDYLPRLKGSSYDDVTIRNALQMASGVQWDEDYADPKSDVNTYPWYDLIALYDFLGNKPRAAPPGGRFNYNSAETELAGTLVRAAIGNNLSTYLSKKIWQPFGMESDASWLMGAAGSSEIGGCCINATLRDYARIGLFALNDGVLGDGTRILPEGWIEESTSPSKGFAGYGYLWWLIGDGTYEARGVFGQIVHIDPARNIVIAKHAVWVDAMSARDLRFDAAFFRAVASTLEGPE